MGKHSSSNLSLEQFQKLTSSIYDAALQPDQWNNVLNEIANALNAEQAYMRIINTESNKIQHSYSYNKDPYWMQAYKDYYFHIDPWLNDLLKAENTVITCTHHLITNKKYKAMEYHRGLVEPQKIHYGLGGKIKIGNSMTSYLALNRDYKKNGFEDRHLNTLKALTPHLQKAILINKRTAHIELQKNLLRDSLNQINTPLLLVNNNGKILFINALAEQLIEQQEGIIIKNNHVFILSSESNNRLRNLIHQATDEALLLQQGGAMQYQHPGTQSSISILVNPVNPLLVDIDTQSNENALLILSRHNHQQTITIERLTDLYRLTKAEARLTVELCHGLTLNEITEKFSLSKNTLRSQLRSSFNKTGTCRQAELIRLINTGPAGSISTM